MTRTPPSPVESAIRWLGSRRRFEREVRAFLRKQGHADAQVAEALDRLKELGLVSDEETCRAFVRDRARFAPRGRGLLLAELRRKGVAADVAEAALAEELTPGREVDAATDWLRRSARKWSGLPFGEARARMLAALARRGFGRDVAREALGRAAGEPPAGADTFPEEEDGAAFAPEEP